MFAPIVKENQLVIGKPTSEVAILTLWTPVSRVKEQVPKAHYAAIGQLYSATRGLGYFLRNLLANPTIRYVIVCGKDESGSGKALKAFVQDGFRRSVDGKDWVMDTPFESYIDGDIPEEALRTIRERVEFYWAIGGPLSNVTEYAQILNSPGRKKGPWGEPIVLLPAVTEAERLPAEPSAVVIRGEKVSDVTLKIWSEIWHFGEELESGYDAKHKEVLNLVSVITGERPHDWHLPGWMGVTYDQLDAYLPKVVGNGRVIRPRVMTGEKLTYEYADRLRSWFGRDQIGDILDKLEREETSKSAVFSLWDPSYDNTHEGSPCLNHGWVRVRGGKLYLTATIRSNDMVDAYPKNALSLRYLQQYLVDKVNEWKLRRLRSQDPDGARSWNAEMITLGDLTIVSESAHIYEHHYSLVQDIVTKPRQEIWKEHWRRERNRFDGKGNFVIGLVEKEGQRLIVAEHTDAGDGRTLGTYSGRTAVAVMNELVGRNLFSSTRHAGYLGQELQKAEVALKMGLEYTQDRPLDYDRVRPVEPALAGSV